MAQGFIFFGAGFETTNVLLQMASFYLVKNKNHQQTLIDEVDEVKKWIFKLSNLKINF